MEYYFYVVFCSELGESIPIKVSFQMLILTVFYLLGLTGPDSSKFMATLWMYTLSVYVGKEVRH